MQHPEQASTTAASEPESHARVVGLCLPGGRLGVAALLRSADPGRALIEAYSLSLALQRLQQDPSPPTLLVLDAELLVPGTEAALAAWRAQHPTCSVLMVCEPSQAAALPAAPQARASARATVPQLPPLTKRQAQVLDLVCQGHPNKIIASRLALEGATVKMHVSAVLRALGVSNRSSAVTVVLRSKLS